MVENIVSQALSWGFVCECDHLGNMQILPSRETGRWELHEVGDRWLLLVGGVPQVNLHPVEAIAFLERRSSRTEASEDINLSD